MPPGLENREKKAMTKRAKSSDLVKARKETKRLQREARTRIRKAKKRAKKSGDNIALDNISRLEKSFSKSLTSVGKLNLPKSYRNNVMWEKGRKLQLENLVRKSCLSKKREKRQTRRTFERLFGKEKTQSLLKTIGGSKMTKMSNEFWEQLYKAQDQLFAIGIVPADEIMGKWGSIGSGLLDTGKQMVHDGYWENVTIEMSDGETSNSYASTDIVAKTERKKIETSELSDAIVNWYKAQYGRE